MIYFVTIFRILNHAAPLRLHCVSVLYFGRLMFSWRRSWGRMYEYAAGDSGRRSGVRGTYSVTTEQTAYIWESQGATLLLPDLPSSWRVGTGGNILRYSIQGPYSPGSEPSIIGGLVYRESQPWALKRSLDAYGEFQVPITNNFSSSKVNVCFSCAATLCENKELIIITLMNGNRGVMKRINTWCNNCVRCEVL